jgi:hypothetical protein
VVIVQETLYLFQQNDATLDLRPTGIELPEKRYSLNLILHLILKYIGTGPLLCFLFVDCSWNSDSKTKREKEKPKESKTNQIASKNQS